MKFAIYLGNRGFCPESLVESAKAEIKKAIEKTGHECLFMPDGATKYGAIETIFDGEKFAEFLKENDKNHDGAILCMPNFSDENGAVSAFIGYKKPILIQAYPDEIGKMDFAHRRDAYCGKFSIMDYFRQCGIKYTILKPHVCHPLSKEFAENLDTFARVCKVVNSMKRFKLGIFGARCSAYKTVRYDEIALQKYGITCETFDLSELFDKVAKYDNKEKIAARVKALKAYADFSKVPEDKPALMAKVIEVILQYKEDYRLDVISLRCWNEFPQILKISACTIVSYLTDIGLPCSCEVDVLSAVAMKALGEASFSSATCLDWNNNYGTEKDKCILFHCGPVPQSMMDGKGSINAHKMFEKSYGEGCSHGVNEGRIKSGDFTYAEAKTENGVLSFYMGEGKFTKDTIEKEYFGCAAVAEIKDLEDVLLYIAKNGHRHHVALSFGNVKAALEEAFTNYLGFELKVF